MIQFFICHVPKKNYLYHSSPKHSGNQFMKNSSFIEHIGGRQHMPLVSCEQHSLRQNVNFENFESPK